ncbi:hypothetical protein P8452_68670 [Trifolium repens]|nr:hypothetical protein P8452_68670 [Trifolium repens]
MEQEKDQLSNLPKIILHNILSRLPEEDAARTSVLSKTWLEIWYTFPILSLSDIKIISAVPHQPVEDLPRKSKDFIEYVKTTLFRFWDRRLAIKEFKLSVKCFELGYTSKDVDLCLKLASESGVEVLKLCNVLNKKDEEELGEWYVLPKCVIEVKSLTKLVLEGRIRVDQAFMNHSIKFFSLKELYLFHVFFEDEQAIEHLISYCPLIELITLIFRSAMKSLTMHALQKLKKVDIKGIEELYIDEAPSLETLHYYCEDLDTPFKIDSIQCENLKELFLSLNMTTIITTKWFLELFLKFRFLERLELCCGTMSEQINISSVRLKFLTLSCSFTLKEANIDAPNLVSCTIYYSFGDSKPIVSFLRTSSQLEVHAVIMINDSLNVRYAREFLQNIKPQNVLTSLSLCTIKTTVDAPNPMLLDISSPPPSIKHLKLRNIFPLTNENLASDFVVSLLLCCIPTTISFNLDTCSKAFIEFLYETLMRRKEDDCFCSSSDTKCWWHNLKDDVTVTSSMKIHKNVDLKTILESLSTFAPDDYITFRLGF